MQLTLLKQPARLIGAEVDVAGWTFALRLQPAQIGMRRDRGIIRDAFAAAAHPAAYQPLSGKQSHLRVVSNLSYAVISRCVLSDPLRAEATENIVPLYKLNRCAQRIADSTPKQATNKPLPNRALLWKFWDILHGVVLILFLLRLSYGYHNATDI